jgi:hypothetical protein
MPLQATSGAASYDAFGGGVPVVPQYIEEVFSTYIYTGNGANRSINNGIDLSTKGGMVWFKGRNFSFNNAIFDTARGTQNFLITNATNATTTNATTLTAFNTNGFSVGADTTWGVCNLSSSYDYVSWTFREQPKFFDIVTYTGTGANRTIAHSLGSVPGCIMVKRTDTTSDWQVYHRSLANTEYMVLNTTAAKATGATRWNSTTPTSTVFSVGTDATVNASGGTYVAYIYAHDAGGFGLAGTDNVISCGTFTTDGSGNATVNLGYEPQFLMEKNSSDVGGWFMTDIMRGMSVAAFGYSTANSSAAESSGAGQIFVPTATGFQIVAFTPSITHIYIAIRKGPMKVPTDATKVFSPITSSAALGTVLTTGFPIDTQFIFYRDGSLRPYVTTRLIKVATTAINNGDSFLQTATFAAEVSPSSATRYWDNTGFQMSNDFAGGNTVFESFRRAPSFFDVVCYTGTGSNTTQTHNLASVPELMLVKGRSGATAWQVYSSALANTEYVVLNTTAAKATGATRWNSTTPTASVFSIGTAAEVNNFTATYVAYLFATCAGVSKVGSYTGNGTTQTINCGFTGGARFVLIKRTDSTGDWYVYDTARGMTTLTDPYFLLNSSAAETATLGSVTTVTTGFALNAAILAAINTNAATYIFLAIA